MKRLALHARTLSVKDRRLACIAQPQAEVIVQGEPPPPPPAQVEVVPVAPSPEYFWVPGYHRWWGGRYVWVGGRYERRPHAEARWEGAHWEVRPNGRVFVEGRWR